MKQPSSTLGPALSCSPTNSSPKQDRAKLSFRICIASWEFLNEAAPSTISPTRCSAQSFSLLALSSCMRTVTTCGGRSSDFSCSNTAGYNLLQSSQKLSQTLPSTSFQPDQQSRMCNCRPDSCPLLMSQHRCQAVAICINPMLNASHVKCCRLLQMFSSRLWSSQRKLCDMSTSDGCLTISSTKFCSKDSPTWHTTFCMI